MDCLPAEFSTVPSVVAQPLHVVAQPSVFREPSRRITQTIPHGATLLELVLTTGMGELRDGVVHLPGKVLVTIDGHEISRDFWHLVRPRPGCLVNITLVPQIGRQAILVGASLAIGIAAVATGGAALPLLGPVGAGLLTAGIAVGGNYALSAFLPLQQDNEGTTGGRAANAVTSQANRLEPGAFVPIVLGSMRLFPMHYARPYTEAAGNDLHMRMLLCVGQGPLNIPEAEIKVGETAITSLSDDFEWEIREGRLTDDPLTLFTRDIHEVNPSTTLGELQGGVPNAQIQTTQINTTEITLDLTWQGIFHQGKQKRDPYTVEFTLEISPTGAGTWTDFVTGSGTIVKRHETAETSNLIRRSFRRKSLTAGTYDVRVTRRTSIDHDSNPSPMFWTALRSIQPNDPRPDKTIACIAIRAKRSPTGQVDAISCLAESYALDWNGVAWVEAVTNNPASLGRHLLQGAGINPNPIADSRIDLTSWQEFHDHCVSEAFTFNGVFEDEATVGGERLGVVLAAGRGRLIPPDTKYAVAIDRNGKTISGMITPRNSSDFAGSHILRDEVQALRIPFINANEGYTQDERLVFADGFDDSNVDDGKIEIFDLTRAGITDPDLVWRHGRYRLADLALRLDVYTVTQGIESLQHVPGDLVAFQHHAALLGLRPGRIKSVTTDGSGQVTAVTVDELLTMEEAKTYAVRVRLIDSGGVDQYVDRAVTTVAGSGHSLTFPTPFAAAASPQIGNLLSFGETGLVTVNAIVKDVIPGPNKTAQITLVDEAPAVNEADTGTIPPFDSQITLPGDFFGNPPAVPVIADIAIRNASHPAQPDVITQQQMIVHLEAIGSAQQIPTGYEVEIKRADHAIYQRRYSFPADTVEFTIDLVESDVLYDVRVRATGRSPRRVPNESAWSTVRQIYVPLPQVTTASVAKVAGLELQGQANNTTFQGPDAHLVWRIKAASGAFQIHEVAGQLLGFTDPQFAWFEVEVLDPANSNYVRRKITTVTPEYIYSLADNKEDSRKQAAALGGSTRPLRRFTVRVTFVDRFGRRGPGQTLTVENPAPEEPSGLQVLGKLLAINVFANEDDDGDYDGLRVFIGTSSGFDPAAQETELKKTNTNHILIGDQPAGVLRYVRVANADRFSDDVPDLNLSNEIEVAIEAPEGPPQFAADGIRFTPNSSTNIVRWTSGTIYVQHGASVTSEPVAAGQAQWTADTLWLFYVRGSGVLQASTNPGVAQADDRIALAQYRGGKRVTRTTGEIPPANRVSERRSGEFGTAQNTWVTLVTAEPIETAGNPVTAEMMIDVRAQVSGVSVAVEALVRLRRNGVVLRTWGLARDTTGGGGGTASIRFIGTLQFEDEAAAGTHVYDLQGRFATENDPVDEDIDWSDPQITLEESLY